MACQPLQSSTKQRKCALSSFAAEVRNRLVLVSFVHLRFRVQLNFMPSAAEVSEASLPITRSATRSPIGMFSQMLFSSFLIFLKMLSRLIPL